MHTNALNILKMLNTYMLCKNYKQYTFTYLGRLIFYSHASSGAYKLAAVLYVVLQWVFAF
jgi:hypothetical protein